MLILNDAQAAIVESLLTKMLIRDSYSVAQLEEAISWFQHEGDTVPGALRGRVSCPFEQVWGKTLAQEIVRELRNQAE